METRTYNVYSFNELSKEGKEKAIDTLRYSNVNHDWYDFTTDEYKSSLQKIGFSDVSILFSGFGSQGDGACFTGRLDSDGLLKFLTESKKITQYPTLVRALKKGTIYVNVKITHTDRYCHENSTTIEDYTEMQDNGELPAKLRKEYDAWYSTFDARGPRNESVGWYYDTCREIYRTLEREYDYLTSDEAIIETIEANDYEFLESGKLV